MPDLTVHLKGQDQSYDLIIKKGVLDHLADHIQAIYDQKKISIVTDDNVNHYYGDRVVHQLQEAGYQVQRLVVPAGESSKSMRQLIKLYKSFIEFNLSRSDLIIALGGGVVGDLCGYAAASYLRGVDYVQVPTTLLAQVDSSVGGKVAVDLEEGKNLVGDFYHPKQVIIDPDVLDTLEDSRFADGMAEVIKYGCIYDADLFSQLKTYNSRQAIMEDIEALIHRCCQIKAEVVEADEKDKGLRMILNFGHTLGHAIEAHYQYESYTHGQGVAIGMVAINQICEDQGLSPQGTTAEIIEMVDRYGLPQALEDPSAYADILALLKNDKKQLDGQLNLIILDNIGQAAIHPASADFFHPLLKEA